MTDADDAHAVPIYNAARFPDLAQMNRASRTRMNDLVSRAKTFAFDAHNAIGQRRKYTDEPYTSHLERVAQLVASVVEDDAMVAAAYLHDTVEDTAISIDDISRAFGDDVAYLVNCLSDVSRPEDGNRAERKRLDREHIARGDARVHTIKLADLIDNAASIGANDPKFAKVYMNEKRQLLDVINDGHPTLFKRAQAIVDAWFESGGDTDQQEPV